MNPLRVRRPTEAEKVQYRPTCRGLFKYEHNQTSDFRSLLLCIILNKPVRSGFVRTWVFCAPFSGHTSSFAALKLGSVTAGVLNGFRLMFGQRLENISNNFKLWEFFFFCGWNWTAQQWFPFLFTSSGWMGLWCCLHGEDMTQQPAGAVWCFGLGSAGRHRVHDALTPTTYKNICNSAMKLFPDASASRSLKCWSSFQIFSRSWHMLPPDGLQHVEDVLLRCQSASQHVGAVLAEIFTSLGLNLILFLRLCYKFDVSLPDGRFIAEKWSTFSVDLIPDVHPGHFHPVLNNSLV